MGNRIPRDTWETLVPWCSTCAIVMNVYNGDILPIHENLEYLLWYAVPLLGRLARRDRAERWFQRNHVLIFGAALNLFWYYESPFRPHRTVRHRTEYYDTQCLLCGMLYHAMYEQLRPPGREAAGASEL